MKHVEDYVLYSIEVYRKHVLEVWLHKTTGVLISRVISKQGQVLYEDYASPLLDIKETKQ